MPQGLSASAQAVFRRAQQGHADAQFNLGAIYANGEGIPEDYVEAYAWWSVAATNGNKFAEEALPDAKARLTPEQLAEQNKDVAFTEHGVFRDVGQRNGLLHCHLSLEF